MQMHSLSFDISHTLAGGLVLISFMMLYQDRLYSLLNVFALHALVLALSVAWQAYVQDAPHLYVTAAIALVFKAIVIPVALHRIVNSLGFTGISSRPWGSARPCWPDGAGRPLHGADAAGDGGGRPPGPRGSRLRLVGRVARASGHGDPSQRGQSGRRIHVARERAGAGGYRRQGHAARVEISVAFSILIAFIVIGIFLFRIRERFDSVDVSALDDYRGERR